MWLLTAAILGLGIIALGIARMILAERTERRRQTAAPEVPAQRTGARR